VSLGNPHCVVFCERVTEQEARRWGPSLESHPLFPRRTNVQFVRVIDRSTIQIEIWERGAGYTLSSGTSSCAAVAVAHRLGHVDPAVRVRCQGGELLVEVLMDGTMVLIGPVARVAECWVDVNEC
jgi:diaminopimelate epimerase